MGKGIADHKREFKVISLEVVPDPKHSVDVLKNPCLWVGGMDEVRNFKASVSCECPYVWGFER